jgi:hypothetical protein
MDLLGVRQGLGFQGIDQYLGKRWNAAYEQGGVRL